MKKLSNVTISANEKLSLISNLATMFTAGIPILETVDSLLEDSKGNIKIILETLRSDLMQGQHVSQSFARFPKVFDKVTVNIIRASEEAGTLDVTLKDLKDTIKKQMEFNDKVRSALIYPMFIFVVFGLVMVLMLTFVVPRISTVFSRLRVDLPLPTKILIFMSNLVVETPIQTITVAAVVIGSIVFLYVKKKSLFVSALLSLPLVSDLAKNIDLTNFTRSMYLLLYAGIPITSALELTEDIVKKRDVLHAIQIAKNTVLSGRKITEGFKQEKKVFPTLIIKIIEAGEKSGSLDKSMQDASEYLDYEVTSKLKTATTIIEPAMLLLVGGVVGGMMLAIIAPIYGLIGTVGGR